MAKPVLPPILAAIAATRVGNIIRNNPPRTASHPKTVTTTGQPAQILWVGKMASPAMNDRIPDTKMRPVSREICSDSKRKEPKLNNMPAAMAISVGPIRPAIIFEFVTARLSRLDTPAAVSTARRRNAGESARKTPGTEQLLDQITRWAAFTGTLALP